MVKRESEARSNYIDGLEEVGTAAYRQASNADSISEAAEALEDAAPSAEINFETFASNWADEY